MDALVYPKEKLYFGVCLAVSVLIYLLLVVSILGIFYIIGGVVVATIGHGLFVGHLKGNGVRVSERQFPEVYRLARQSASVMELDPMPDVYVLQAGGMLNAFATRFLGRSFVIIYSDVLELAYDDGEAALGFIVAHELAHIKRNHLTWKWVLYPSMFVPFLGSAHSRACEYTCDRFGAHCQPSGAVPGLLVLAAGKRLYRQVGSHDFIHQLETEGGFWVSFAEILSTHPNLPKRVRAVVSFGAENEHERSRRPHVALEPSTLLRS
jgi:Zn-dependent protease with chaperone function